MLHGCVGMVSFPDAGVVHHHPGDHAAGLSARCSESYVFCRDLHAQLSHVCVVYENNACDFIYGSSGVKKSSILDFDFFIMGTQATKGQPKKAAAKEPAQKKAKERF